MTADDLRSDSEDEEDPRVLNAPANDHVSGVRWPPRDSPWGARDGCERGVVRWEQGERRH